MPRPLRFSALALTAVVLVACGSGGSAPSKPSPARSSAPAWGGAVTTVPVGDGPVGLAATPAGAVWVAQAQAGQVSRLATGQVAQTVGAVNVPLRVTTTTGTVWTTEFGAGALARVDAVSGRVTTRIPIGRGAEGVAAGLGAIWVVTQDDGRLVKVDPRSGRVVGRAVIETGARLVTTGLGAVWVSHFRSGRVLRVDPGSLRVTTSAVLCQGPQGILTTADAVWLTCTGDDVALRLDPHDLRVTARVRLPDAPDGITVGPGGAVYVVCQAGPTVVELDPRSGAVRRQRVLGSAAQLYDQANDDIAATSDAVWVSSYGENRVYRVPA